MARKRKRVETETPEARERRLAAAREYVKANRERVAAYKAQWAEDNSARRAENVRAYYEQNSDKIKQRANEWRRNNNLFSMAEAGRIRRISRPMRMGGEVNLHYRG